jgi:hypothetical protein
MPSKSAAAVALPALEKAEVSSYDPKLFHTHYLSLMDSGTPPASSRSTRRALSVCRASLRHSLADG